MSVRQPLRSRRPGRREEVQAQIRAALLDLLETRSLTELSIDEIAQAAGVSRSAFYFYFRDKYDVLEPAVAEIGDRLFAEADRWFSGPGGRTELVREALTGILSIHAENRSLLRVIAEVAAYDAEVRGFWRNLVERFVEPTAARIASEQAAGRGRAVDPRQTATCLVWMVERVAHVQIVRGDRSVEEVAGSLTPVWLAAVYRGTR